MKKQGSSLILTLLCCLLGTVSVQAQTRILPLGDSVTSSFAPYSSFRYWLWQSLMEANYDVTFVGTQYGVADGQPDKTDYNQNHEGHPGWTSSDGARYIDSIATATVPDIVLLDLGANDVQDDIAADQSETNLLFIIDHLRQVNPNVLILMAKPTPFLNQNRRGMSLLKGAIKRVAKIEKKQGTHIQLVNLAGGFNVRKDTFDGTHPNESGEQKIAKRYFAALKKALR